MAGSSPSSEHRQALAPVAKASSTIRSNGLSLRWRITLVSGLVIGLLSIVATLAAYWVVRINLIQDLSRMLIADAERAAASLAGGGGGLQDPTGRVIVQWYDPKGKLVRSSIDTYEGVALPSHMVAQVSDKAQHWRGRVRSLEPIVLSWTVQAGIAPTSFGYVAVLAETEYIQVTLNNLARALLLIAVVLTILGVLSGYVVAATAISPIRQLSRLAETRGPDNLQPIYYQGPPDELGRLSNVLNDLLARLRESRDLQRTFLAETSHELRTPLTSLRGFLQRARRRASPEITNELDDAVRISQTMSRLVEDILQLSRGQVVKEYDPYLLDPVEDILKPIAEEFAGVRLEYPAHDDAMMLGDPERLRQLVRNLTANAVRACVRPEHVSLHYSSADETGQAGWVMLQVRDQGRGIDPSILPHIFEKFYKGAGGGSGLGLAIAKQIAEAHGGCIKVESELGKGTTFRIYLPALPEDA